MRVRVIARDDLPLTISAFPNCRASTDTFSDDPIVLIDLGLVVFAIRVSRTSNRRRLPRIVRPMPIFKNIRTNRTPILALDKRRLLARRKLRSPQRKQTWRLRISDRLLPPPLIAMRAVGRRLHTGVQSVLLQSANRAQGAA